VSNTTFLELKRKVFVGFPRTDGEALIAVESAINDALRSIAMVKDFNELIITDITNALTVDGQKTYNLIDDWSLTRPKKIYTLRLMDETLSRKLIFIPSGELDRVLPYAETLSEGRPTHYTLVGENDVELIPIPDTEYSLYVRYSQWPDTLSADTDPTPYTNLDIATIFLAKDIANAYLSGEYFDFTTRAAGYLTAGNREEDRQPDHRRIAQPFSTQEAAVGEYWADPFVRRNP